jgi:hypothetical protein
MLNILTLKRHLAGVTEHKESQRKLRLYIKTVNKMYICTFYLHVSLGINYLRSKISLRLHIWLTTELAIFRLFLSL